MHRMNISEIYTTDTDYESAGVRVVFYELSEEPEFHSFLSYLRDKSFKLAFIP